ncbi:DUF4184 family protein [Neisseria sp. Ec49-e6-T10]|uniref:DUF4184 family protein n=1 Tax=Neisseria sp. Ec49-e6-T10 TaxID=3140744 RepID=UPI003EBFE577
MPFTFAHPAIILPCNRLPRFFSLTGLIIGSMSPDFEHFIRMNIKSNISHSILGLFLFDLPISIIIAFIFHYLIRNTLIDHLPFFLQQRFLSFKSFSFYQYTKKYWFILVYSILIGALSHLFWDSFTHYTGYFVQIFPLLQQTINLTSQFNVPVFKILQHGSTFIGLLLIIKYIIQLPRSTVAVAPRCLNYWYTIMAIAIAIVLLKIVFHSGSVSLGLFVVYTITALFIALTITSICFTPIKKPV